LYGYSLEPHDHGSSVTSYYDWSRIDPVWKEALVFGEHTREQEASDAGAGSATALVAAISVGSVLSAASEIAGAIDGGDVFGLLDGCDPPHATATNVKMVSPGSTTGLCMISSSSAH
jgi:hypothetical protein